MAYFLKRTVGEWSAGTRVEFLNIQYRSLLEYIPGYAYVRVLAGDKPIIEVAEADLVERKKGERDS